MFSSALKCEMLRFIQNYIHKKSTYLGASE